jgi:hypothetical protein
MTNYELLTLIISIMSLVCSSFGIFAFISVRTYTNTGHNKTKISSKGGSYVDASINKTTNP